MHRIQSLLIAFLITTLLPTSRMRASQVLTVEPNLVLLKSGSDHVRVESGDWGIFKIQLKFRGETINLSKKLVKQFNGFKTSGIIWTLDGDCEYIVFYKDLREGKNRASKAIRIAKNNKIELVDNYFL